MLNKIIHKHLDQMDAIRDEVDEDIDSIFQHIDINELLSNPEDALDYITDIIYTLVKEEYLDKAVSQGIEYAKELSKAKNVIVEDTNDPTANKELANDKNKD